MSRYDFKQGGYFVEVGWDEALQTLFLQIFEEANDDEPILWEGMGPGEIREIPAIERLLSRFGLVLPEEVRSGLQGDDGTVSEPRGRSPKQIRDLGFDEDAYSFRAKGEFSQAKRSAVLVEKMWDNYGSLVCFFIDLDDSSKFRVSAYNRGGKYKFAGSDLDASLLRRGSMLALELGATKSGYLKASNAAFLGIHPRAGEITEIIR